MSHQRDATRRIIVVTVECTTARKGARTGDLDGNRYRPL